MYFLSFLFGIYAGISLMVSWMTYKSDEKFINLFVGFLWPAVPFIWAKEMLCNLVNKI